jgi:hypothetical protein
MVAEIAMALHAEPGLLGDKTVTVMLGMLYALFGPDQTSVPHMVQKTRSDCHRSIHCRNSSKRLPLCGCVIHPFRLRAAAKLNQYKTTIRRLTLTVSRAAHTVVVRCCSEVRFVVLTSRGLIVGIAR